MNHRLSLPVAAGVALFGLFALVAFAEQDSEKAEAETATSTFHVTGMTCGGCEVGVRRVVKKLEGIENVEASHKNGTATVTYRTDQVHPDDIIAAIEELGYTAELEVEEEAGA